MIKKITFGLLIFTLLNTAVTAEDTCGVDTLATEVIGAGDVLNDSVDYSASLVENSKSILDLSKSLLSAGSQANRDYVNAMLQLSDDILTMADKIGEMADRILVMADDIGDMADRIVETQKIQSENVKLTQANILEAQKNFNDILST